MIHSMAGGRLGSVSYDDWAKVKITQGPLSGQIFWYVCTGVNLQAQSIVLVPVGAMNTLVQAVVERVDRGVSSQCSPVAVRRAKRVAKVESN